MVTASVNKLKKRKVVRAVVLPPIRCSVKEQARIREKAATAGVSVSAYVRHKALSGRVAVRKSHRIDPAYVEQLRRIGVNLNQITKAVHEEARIPPELYSVLLRINAVMDAASSEAVKA